MVGETIKRHEPLPADLEGAWAAWSAGVGKVDARGGMALLRAAFEAGWEAGKGRETLIDLAYHAACVSSE